MMGELRWTRQDVIRTRDGIDLDTLDLSLTDRAAMTIIRRFDAMAFVRGIGGGHALCAGIAAGAIPLAVASFEC